VVHALLRLHRHRDGHARSPTDQRQARGRILRRLLNHRDVAHPQQAAILLPAQGNAADARDGVELALDLDQQVVGAAA
jgi:hypothetical protein